MKKLLPILTFCLFCLNCEQGWLKDILIPVVEGCTDSNSCNYNSDATEDDGSCYYPTSCDNECGSTAVVDECGECGGSGLTCEGMWPIYYTSFMSVNTLQFDIIGVEVDSACCLIDGFEFQYYAVEPNLTRFIIDSQNDNILTHGGLRLLIYIAVGIPNDACIGNVITDPPLESGWGIHINNCNTIDIQP